MAKQITTKTQIPKWYKGRIKNFENLTENEALFEYEGLKLRERARKYAKRQNKSYIAPKIVRPSVVAQGDINYLRKIELAEIKEAVIYQEPIVRYNAPIYDYEFTDWKRENLPDYSEPHYEDYQSSFEDDIDDEFYDEDGTRYWERPDYSTEEEYLSDSEEQAITDALNKEYGEQEQLDPDDYWVDPNTGEAILWSDIIYADAEHSAIEFLQDLKAQLQQVADDTAISHSYYANGRTKSASQRNFYNQNIDRALQQVFDKIDAILNDENKLAAFVAKHRGATNDWEALVMAASEYIADSYKSKGTDSAQISQAAKLNALLDAGPISLSEAMDFVDEAYDVDE